MSKSKAKPAAAPPPAKKGGDGGRITKPAAKVEKAKTVAKAVVAAAAAAGPVKPPKVFLFLVPWIPLTVTGGERRNEEEASRGRFRRRQGLV